MPYRVIGIIKRKKYVSRPFETQETALKAAYDKVYMKDGNTRRKNQLHDFHIAKSVKGQKLVDYRL